MDCCANSQMNSDVEQRPPVAFVVVNYCLLDCESTGDVHYDSSFAADVEWLSVEWKSLAEN